MTYVPKSPAQLCMEFIPNALGSFTDPNAAWRLCIGKMSDKPDQQIGFYDSPGQVPNSKWLLDFPAVQVLVRGTPSGYQAAVLQMRYIYDVLLGAQPRVNANGDSIDAITVLTTPNLIGYDSNARPQISGNFRLIVRPQASPYTNREPL